MSLTLSLNNALSGLNINQQALSVLSQNIANANTVGYSRQIIKQESVFLNDQGLGVSIKDVTRKVDEFLVSSVRTQTAAVGYSSTISDFNDRMQLLLGQPGSNNSMSAYIDSFFNSLQSLAQTPENTTLQRQAVDTANNFAKNMQLLSNGLQDMQYEADHQILDAIRNINADLEQIRDLNASIVTAFSTGKSPADAMDKRDLLLNDLAQYMDIKTFTRENGSVNITSGNGVSLLDESLYRLSYTAVGSAQAFANDGLLSPIEVTRVVDQQGQSTPASVTLVTSGTSENVVSTIASGKIRALIDMRDQQIPDILAQLDVLASTLRDQFNAIHNRGSGYPGAHQLNGTRLLSGTDTNQWSGAVRIGVVNQTGQPIPSPYSNQPGGLPPLTIDLGSLDSGFGAGKPTVQTIIDEINQYYGVPQNKVTLGTLDNIRLASDIKTLPGSPPLFSFDFDLSNRASGGSNFFVTSSSIFDDQGVAMTTPTNTLPSFDLAATDTYLTTDGSRTVVVNTTASHGLTNGTKVYLSTPTSPSTIGGLDASQYGGFYVISNATDTSFEITLATPATATSSEDVASQTVTPPYASVGAGEDMRTAANGLISADLTGNTLSQYYIIKVNVAVEDDSGNITTSQLSYRITNNQTNLRNDRYAAFEATGDALIIPPQSLQPIVRAMLVDANGVELPKLNGNYTTLQDGYLAIRAVNSTHNIVIDSLNSSEDGDLTGSPILATNRSFSHYFELNNFFSSNVPSSSGDTLRGSALNMAVEERLLTNPGLLSLGSFTANALPLDPTQPPTYTYVREKGDNSIIQQLSDAGLGLFSFAGAGGLSNSTQSFNAYAGVIIGSAAQKDATAKITRDNSQTLLDGFASRASSISGVNLDTELANTIIYQNAYAASARIISVANSLFDSLLSSFQ